MGDDRGHGADSLAIEAGLAMRERGGGHTLWTFERFGPEEIKYARRMMPDQPPGWEPDILDFHRLAIPSFRTTEHFGNLITNAGYTRIGNLFTNQGATQAFDATHTRIGVGDGTTAVAYADTDLSAAAGSTHRLFNLVSAVGTIGALRTWTFAATFATGDANFALAWAEFGIDNGTAQGNTVTAPLLNHALTTQGIKPSSQVWTATATITWT
jgi:hypothetical protein